MVKRKQEDIKLEKKFVPGVVATPLTPALETQRQMDLYEFLAILFYK